LTKQYGDELDNADRDRLHGMLRDLIAGGADLALEDSADFAREHALATVLRCDVLTVEQRHDLLVLALEHGADPTLRLRYPQFRSEDGPFVGWHTAESALDCAVALRDGETTGFLELLRTRVAAMELADAYYLHAIDQIPYSTRDDFAPIIALAGDDLD